MNILHLYSNHKWTGPAELALQQVRALNRIPDVRAQLALAGHHDPERPHAIEGRAEQLHAPLVCGLQLRRHFHLRAHWRDAGVLAGWLDAGRFDVLHCHQSGDHLVAALALRRARRKVPLLRSFWENPPPRPGPRARLSFAAADRVLCAFAGQMPPLMRRFSLDSARCRVSAPILGDVPVPADRSGARHALREELGLAPESFIVGLTARIQSRRRWALCWAVLQHLPPETHLAVLGRPDEGVFERLCEQPLRQRGLRHRVHFLGYRHERDYFDALAAFDAFLFLVPGSDATCRALREAMAASLPAVTTDSGFLPEIVQDGKTGMVRGADAQALAQAIARLYREPPLRKRLGRAAARFAREHWQSPRQAKDLLAHYRALAQSV